MRLWYGIGLVLPALAAHANVDWPTLAALQLGLGGATAALLGVAYCGDTAQYGGAGGVGEGGDGAGGAEAAYEQTFAGKMRLCGLLLLPHALALGGAYLVLRAKVRI